MKFMYQWKSNPEREKKARSGITALVAAAALVFAQASCSSTGQLEMMSNDGEFILYTGSIDLSGTYYSDPDNIETQQFVCFIPDASSQRLLPQGPEPSPRHWLCFSNSPLARNLLGLDPAAGPGSGCKMGVAHLSIRDYQRYIAESEGVSFSELTRVNHHDAPLTVPCEKIYSLL